MTKVYLTKSKLYQAKRDFKCNCGLTHYFYSLGKTKKEAIKNIK